MLRPAIHDAPKEESARGVAARMSRRRWMESISGNTMTPTATPTPTSTV
eukprot:CAMPEP_0198131738 /NCGR_PEP_ID=MMETSP1442-20131203/56831_1 /TAXON_ID= /ORGANISM="Craspedostauros australis, Strain CCMP3328" /LENGTH=48 /DNA_ID= /DNA_START= /DNA_END= /DNA_ORIENTATION=